MSINKYINHVKAYAQEHNMSYKDAMKAAKDSYQKVSSNIPSPLMTTNDSNIIDKKQPKKLKPIKTEVKYDDSNDSDSSKEKAGISLQKLSKKNSKKADDTITIKNEKEKKNKKTPILVETPLPKKTQRKNIFTIDFQNQEDDSEDDKEREEDEKPIMEKRTKSKKPLKEKVIKPSKVDNKKGSKLIDVITNDSTSNENYGLTNKELHDLLDSLE